MKEKQKAVVYARVARRDELTLEQQIEHLKSYANDHDFEVIETISDLGVVGIKNQATIERLVNHPALDASKHLLCHSPSILSRDSALLSYAMTQLHQKGVSVTFTQTGPIDPRLFTLYDTLCETMKKAKSKH